MPFFRSVPSTGQIYCFAMMCTWITPIIQNISLCQLSGTGVTTPFTVYRSLNLLASKLWFLTNLWFERKFTAHQILSDIFNILSLPIIQVSIMSITLYFLWIYESQKNRGYRYQSEMLWGSNCPSRYHRISQMWHFDRWGWRRHCCGAVLATVGCLAAPMASTR